MEENVSFTSKDVADIDGMPKVEAVPVEGDKVDETPIEEKAEETKETKTEVLEEKKEEVKEEAVPEDDRLRALEDQWNKKFSALSRRERFVSQKERDSNDKGRMSEAERKELEELKTFQKKFNENPYGVMDEKGHTYENWTQKILAGEPMPKADPVPNDIRDIRAELEGMKKREETQNQGLIQAQRQQVYQNQINEINKVIIGNKEAYPLVNVFGDTQVVFDVMAEKYKQDALEYDEEYAKENLMSIEEAAKHTETWRESVVKEKKDAMEPFRKKLGELFAEETSAEDKDKEALKIIEEKEGIANPESSQKQGTLPERTRILLGAKKRAKTLTNQQQTTVPAREDKPFSTEQERIDHAASFLRHDSA